MAFMLAVTTEFSCRMKKIHTNYLMIMTTLYYLEYKYQIYTKAGIRLSQKFRRAVENKTLSVIQMYGNNRGGSEAHTGNHCEIFSEMLNFIVKELVRQE